MRTPDNNRAAPGRAARYHNIPAPSLPHRPAPWPCASAKPLPPYGRAIVAMLERRERPEIFGGAIVAALAWDIGETWPRIVIPDEPHQYRLAFARGLDWLVLSRAGHPAYHVAAVVEALQMAGAHVVAPVTLPDPNGGKS